MRPPQKGERSKGTIVTSEEIHNRSRRTFIVAGSAAIALPMFLNPIDPVKAATATAKKANKDKIYYITSKCIG